VENAHSLYLETLGELGIVGLVLLLTAIGLILGAFAYRARGPDRAMFAALLAAGLVWAVHAGVDWDWQMPAVTLWLFAFGGAALARSLRWRRRRKVNLLRRSALRAAGVIGCLMLAIVPGKLALSQARLSSAIKELNQGNCRQAQADAESSLSAVSQRPTPYVVLASCNMKENRYGAAAVALQRALQRDPKNWQIQYNLAVARAGAGLNPRRAARAAARLNPNEEIAASAPIVFAGRSAQNWKDVARRSPVLPAREGDP
jgi:hypothetical protein